MKDYDSQHATRYFRGRLRLPACCSVELRVPECNVRPGIQRAAEPTVPSMQQHRPQFMAPRWTLFRRDLFDSRERVLESRAPLGHGSAEQFWPAEPVQTKPRRDGLGPGPGFDQAAFEAAPAGSSWGLPPFEQRWRAGSLSPAPLGVGAAITMATVASPPCAGGSQDILWRVSVCAEPLAGVGLRGPALTARACWAGEGLARV